MKGVYVGLKKENLKADFEKKTALFMFPSCFQKCRKSAEKSAELHQNKNI